MLLSRAYPEVLDCEIHIPVYNLVRKDRNRLGGGFAIYIRAHVNVNTLQLPHPDLELFLLESYFNSHLYTIGGF